ncbi:glycine betaine ABC transporter substrate-binding protein [Salinisphaera hydrothermalis]|uniref:glycine betaine ABC transporter substrate-binding protein n=1 Tax=Salinisphaera hydrothermalis TaxID=563188 RepID=UPI0033419BFB
MTKTKSSWLQRAAVAAGLILAGTTLAQAASAPTISFGVPPWPGVSVKTQIAEQLLETLGYQTQTKNIGLPFIYRGLTDGNTDVFMGAWLPAQKDMLGPLVKKKQVIKLGSNLSGAIEGLAVPDYVWNKGIHSIQDLAAHPKMFDHKIYGIEAGSAMDQAISKAVKDNYEGLGSYKMVPSSTAAMLAQLKHSSPKKQPMVFLGWRPHWMNIKFDIHYLKDKKGSPIAGIKSQVLTLVSAKLGDDNVKTLLDHIHVNAKTQSRWIYDYSYKKGDMSDVAHKWLASHPKTVEKWLAGVKTVDGKSAVAAYHKAYGG